MNRYSSYKDSGVEWIGEIPSHWTNSKFKYSSTLFTGNSLNDEQKLRYESDDPNHIPYISSKDIDVIYKTIDYHNGLRIPRENNPFRIGPKGSFVMVVEGGSSGKKMGVLEQDVCFVNKLCCFVSNHNSKFQYYFVQSSNFQDKFLLSMTGLIGGVSISSLRDFEIPLPPLSEQHQIVSYLDNKTSSIDSLIQSKEKKIELLKEKRTSLINQVVTKGLNPDVEMKDSGVEWIGSIPKEWERKRLKHICDSVNGYSFKSDDFDKNYDVPVIRIGDVSDIIDFDECVKVQSHFLEDKSEFIVRKYDILIGLTGGTIGKSGRYNYDFPSLLNQRVGLLRNRSSVLNNLLYHYVKSDVFMRYIYYDCYGGGQDNISMGDILDMVFPLPPLHEQHQIVSYLDKETKLIDETISSEQKKIELLKEYKQSLISEVVTGKRKVTTDD